MTSLVPLGTGASAVRGISGQVRMGEQSLRLDHGGVLVAMWSDDASMVSDIQTLSQRSDITVRLVSGALIADLSLQDNLTLEAALCDGNLRRHLVPEIDTLFANSGCPVDWPVWTSTFTDTATAIAMMQAKVGRAWMADPDVLVIDAAQWNDTLIDAQRFSRSFTQQNPWRTLVWATQDKHRASALCEVLKEFQA